MVPVFHSRTSSRYLLIYIDVRTGYFSCVLISLLAACPSSQDEVATVPKVNKKHKEKNIDASLFDDNIDIFADLTDTFKPSQKSKTKGQAKSIFDDDMGKEQQKRQSSCYCTFYIVISMI